MGNWGAFFQKKKKNKQLTYIDDAKYSFDTFFRMLFTPNDIVENGRNTDKYIDFITLFETKNKIELEKNQHLPFGYIDYAI